MGLSTITRGGTDKVIDGISRGPQFDQNDPFYLDGQRLIEINSTTFETEHYSKIKITRDPAMNATIAFTIQYPDGKIAYYKQFGNGQYNIVTLKDAFDNEIHYTYELLTGSSIYYITMISYGNTAVSVTGGGNLSDLVRYTVPVVSNDPFRIKFFYKSRGVSNKSYRASYLFNNNKVLSVVQITSAYSSALTGYRKYLLTHDKIHGNAVERLTKIVVQNTNTQYLKPLIFEYNSAMTGTIIPENKTNGGFDTNAKSLGSVAVGDFYNTGKPRAIYEVKQLNGTYKINNSWSSDSNPKSRNFMVGRSLSNDKISEYDQLISTSFEYSGSDVPGANASGLFDYLNIVFKDLQTSQTKTQLITFTGGTKIHELYFDYFGPVYANSIRDKRERKIISGDYNNDGLIDILIFELANHHRAVAKVYFAEIGRLPAGQITPITLTFDANYFNMENEINSIEYDGDGIPDLLMLDKTASSIKIFKVDLLTNELVYKAGESLSDFTPKTPLIFGDFNGDGLTDFITPKKVYSLDNSSAAVEIGKMTNDQQFWWEYIGTGSSSFSKTQKDYTAQKLAYMAPSQRNIIHRPSFWSKLWNGQMDSYSYTEYGASNIIPIDYNNDGKTDLISFKKFGNIKYSLNGKLKDAVRSELDANVQASLNSAYFNKLYFHYNKTLPNGDVSLVNSETSITLDNNYGISPLSMVLNNSDFNQLNTYQNELVIHDPLAYRDFTFTINNDDFTEGQMRGVNNGSSVVQKLNTATWWKKTIPHTKKYIPLLRSTFPILIMYIKMSEQLNWSINYTPLLETIGF